MPASINTDKLNGDPPPENSWESVRAQTAILFPKPDGARVTPAPL